MSKCYAFIYYYAGGSGFVVYIYQRGKENVAVFLNELDDFSMKEVPNCVRIQIFWEYFLYVRNMILFKNIMFFSMTAASYKFFDTDTDS